MSYYSSISRNTLFICICSALALFVCSFIIANRQLKKSIWFGLAAYVFMMSLGALTLQLHHEKNHKNHYTKLVASENNQPKTIIFKIREQLKPSLYYNKYIAELISIDNKSVTGTTLLNITKDSINKVLTIDDVLLTYAEFKPLPLPLNPNQFNYKAYLEKQDIHHQLVIEPASLLTINSEPHTIIGYASILRNTINKQLITYNFKADELAIINALLLGQRQDMSKDLYEHYVDAGAIHILAVSGLHVGIILLLLNQTLRPIERYKRGKFIKVVIILMLLWSFAVIAGLSASVTRAVTMFSIVAIAMHWKRTTNIYNTLAISVLMLLICKPMFVFDVGFQMSYLAVLAIVSIQPLLAKLWQPRWKVINYFWQILTVTLAAQCGVVPISLYYFHQFPGLFFISNLAIIPFLGILLGLGILVIVLALLNSLPELLATLFGTMIAWMNWIVNWVAKQDVFLLKNISFELPQVLVSYLLLITTVLAIRKRTAKRMSWVLISLIMAQATGLILNHKNANQAFTIFHKSRSSILGHKVDSELTIYHNVDTSTISNSQIITNYSVGNHISKLNQEVLHSVFIFQNKTILVIDSLGVYNIKSFKPDYVLLRNSPRINLERMIDSIQPKFIIADGSNYKSYIKRWELTCVKRQLPFHQTGKKGAFIIK
nr:ComEC/Rec2 family competence protein [Psychroserpens sp. SPM9]